MEWVMLVMGACAGLVLGWAITVWSYKGAIRWAMLTGDRFGYRRGLRAGREDERRCWTSCPTEEESMSEGHAQGAE